MIRVDILSQPSEKPQNVENVIRFAAKQVGIEVQVNHTTNFAAYSQFAINPSQTPIIFINGSLEFAGRVPEINLLKLRLAEIRNQGP